MRPRHVRPGPRRATPRAVAVALVTFAGCVPPRGPILPPGVDPSPGPQSPATTAAAPTTAVPSTVAVTTTGAPAEEPTTTAPAQPGGCDADATARMTITGLVRLADGQPPAAAGPAARRIATLRDHALQPGAAASEASVNDAGFFFLVGITVPVAPECPKAYTVEVTLETVTGTIMYGELDVTDLFVAARPGSDIVDADITSTPIVLEVISEPSPDSSS